MEESEKKRRFRIERRERLIRLIEDLRGELAHVEEELRLVPAAYKQRLNEAFFWSEVMPLLREAGERGASTKELREKLAKKDKHVDRPRFSVFLSRIKTKGLIEIVDITSKFGRWKLTKLAEREIEGGLPKVE